MRNSQLANALAAADAATRSELLTHVGRGVLSRAVCAGDVVRVLPSTYARSDASTEWAARARAALVWAGDQAALADDSALHAWGLTAAPPATVTVAVPLAQRRRCPPWLRARRIGIVNPLREVEGMATLDPAESIVRGYHLVREPDLIYQAVRTGLASAQELADALERVPRVSQLRALRRHIDAALSGAESFLEERGLTEIFAGPDFEGLVRQQVVIVGGVASRLDVFDPETLTAFELDGARFHDTPAARARDVHRDARLASVGIQTVRFRYQDVIDRPQWCAEMARAVLASRRQVRRLLG